MSSANVPSRVILFTGKGGVGKTTCAAATAAFCAAAGRKTLAVSTDPAHSLADALAVPLSAESTEVSAHLYGMQVDTHIALSQAWQQVRSYLAQIIANNGLASLTAHEVLTPPGVDEIFALRTVTEQVHSGAYDVVVVDCAPTAETLRLLALPEALGWLVDRLSGLHRFAAPLRSVLGVPLPDQAIVQALSELQIGLAEAQQTLRSAHASVRLVLTPERVVVAETLRTYTSLCLLEYTVDSVLVNRMIPPGGQDDWRTRWAAVQADQLALVREGFVGVPVRTLPYCDAEPIGIAALTHLGGVIYGDADPCAIPLTQSAIRVHQQGTAHVLTVKMPHTEPGAVDVTRVGDGITITIGGVRRRVCIPESLRNHDITYAELHDGELTIRFTDGHS